MAIVWTNSILHISISYKTLHTALVNSLVVAYPPISCVRTCQQETLNYQVGKALLIRKDNSNTGLSLYFPLMFNAVKQRKEIV